MEAPFALPSIGNAVHLSGRNQGVSAIQQVLYSQFLMRGEDKRKSFLSLPLKLMASAYAPSRSNAHSSPKSSTKPMR